MKLRKMMGILLYSLTVVTAYCIPRGANDSTTVTIGATLIKPLTLDADKKNPTTHITTEDLTIKFDPIILTATGSAGRSIIITTPNSITLKEETTFVPVTIPVDLEGGTTTGTEISKSVILGDNGSAQTKLTIATTENLPNTLEVGTYQGVMTVSAVYE